MNKYLVLVSIFIFSSLASAQSSRIRVNEVTRGNCRMGDRATTITVQVDNRYRSYNVKCDERFSTFFTLSGGNSCNIDAGMCSGSYPLEEFRVRCSDRRRASIRISCE